MIAELAECLLFAELAKCLLFAELAKCLLFAETITIPSLLVAIRSRHGHGSR
jgi:hypothetical protein